MDENKYSLETAWNVAFGDVVVLIIIRSEMFPYDKILILVQILRYELFAE